jgi:Flp pilus assembly pilin Flp
MRSMVRRLTRNAPGRMTIIDYSLIAVLTAYATIQVLLVFAGKAGPI